MQRRDQGSLLANYNSLRDEHLAAFNSDPKRLRHFKQMGLITKDNVILDERLIRENLVHRQQQKQANGMLADSVVSRAIDLERKRRIDIKKKLEFLDKIEKVEKVKNTRHHPPGIQDFDPYETSPSSSPDTDKFMKDMEQRKGKLRGYSASDYRIVPGRTQSPYMDIRILSKSLGIPIIKPRPPSAPRPVRSAKTRRGVTMRRVQTVPFTIPRPSVFHTNTKITLCYVGKSVSLNGYRSFEGSEVMVVQQHCGGNTLTLYRGIVKPKETFQFVSKRHVGSPFGLTIYLDGMMDVRVSGCCEYRHGVGVMLGRTIAHFRVINIEGGSPCFRCKDARDGHGRPRSVKSHTSQVSGRSGRLEPKGPKISPMRNDRETPEGAYKKKSFKGTPKKTPTKGSKMPKKTKRKRESNKSLEANSKAFNRSKTETGDGHLEHEGSDGSSIYEYSSDSSAEESAVDNAVIVAVSSDEMFVKYSDYKYQIEITCEEESEELLKKRKSEGNESQSESESDDEEETRQAEDDHLPTSNAHSEDKDHSSSEDDELSNKTSDGEEQSDEESDDEDHSEEELDEGEQEDKNYDKEELSSGDESQAEESLKDENLSSQGEEEGEKDKISDKESHDEVESQVQSSEQSENEQEKDYLQDKEEFEDEMKSVDERQSKNEDFTPTHERFFSDDEQLVADEDLLADKLSSEELPDFSADEEELQKTPDTLSDFLADRPHHELVLDGQSVEAELEESIQPLEKDINDNSVESDVPS